MRSERGPGPAGVVLAAGRSSRMGQSKALLDAGERTFVEACVAALAEGGCAPVVVVAADEEAVARARDAGAVVVEGRPDGEQVDSLRSGLEALRTDAGSPPAAVVVLPVDHPLVGAGTVRALLDASRRHPASVIRPVYGGLPGHPTLFPASTWASLMDPDLPRGARSVVESDGTDLVNLPVDDPGILADIDTPDAYRRHLGGDP
jgi:molybdenum cofactor cytidylyltransferase